MVNNQNKNDKVVAGVMVAGGLLLVGVSAVTRNVRNRRNRRILSEEERAYRAMRIANHNVMKRLKRGEIYGGTDRIIDDFEFEKMVARYDEE